MGMGADLLVLAVDEERGNVRRPVQVGFALAAAELVELASVRRLDLADTRIRVIERLHTGDAILDEALDALAFEELRPGDWIAARAPDRVVVYAAALIKSGVLRGTVMRTSLSHPPAPYGLRIAKAASRRESLDLLERAVTAPDTYEEEAFAALAHAADLTARALTGLGKWRERRELKDRADWFAEAAPRRGDRRTGAVPVPDDHTRDESWQLLIRAAVGEAVLMARAIEPIPTTHDQFGPGGGL